MDIDGTVAVVSGGASGIGRTASSWRSCAPRAGSSGPRTSRAGWFEIIEDGSRSGAVLKATVLDGRKYATL
jgi:hypothetical protein